MKKKNIVRLLSLGTLFAAMGTLSSCTSGFEEANRPGNKTSQEEIMVDNNAIGSFLIQMQNYAFPEQENTYQHTEDLIGNYL